MVIACLLWVRHWGYNNKWSPSQGACSAVRESDSQTKWRVCRGLGTGLGVWVLGQNEKVF